MKVLTSTSKVGSGKASHSHVVYIDIEAPQRLGDLIEALPVALQTQQPGAQVIQQQIEEILQNGTTVTYEGGTKADRHVHTVRLIPPTPGGVDPISGQQIPPQPARWVLEGEDHTHELLPEYPIDPKAVYDDEEETNEDATVDEVLRLYKEVCSINQDNIERAEEAEGFYDGTGHWDEIKKNELEAAERAALTINKIEMHIDKLGGYYRQSRGDLKCLPRKGDQDLADICNIALKSILSNSEFQYEDADLFDDLCIRGNGAFNVYLDTTEDIEGDIKVERFSPSDYLFGEHKKVTGEDAEVMFKQKWFSFPSLIGRFPKHKAKLESQHRVMFADDATVAHSAGSDPDFYVPSSNSSNSDKWDIGPDLVSRATKQYKVLQCYRVVWADARVALSLDDSNQVFNLYGWSEKDISALKSSKVWEVFERKEPHIRVTTIAGRVLLSDENPADLPGNMFPLVPVYAKKRNNRWWGKVESAKDPQIEVNKRTSQSIDLVNKSLNHGWFYDAETFPSDAEKEHFEENASSPGFVAHITDINRPPNKVESGRFPSESVGLLQIAEQNLRDVMGDYMANAGANTAGPALQHYEKQGQLPNEKLYDNIKRSKKRLGKLLLHYIQKYYSLERLSELVLSYSTRNPGDKINGQPAQEFTPEQIVAVLQNRDITKLDIEVTESVNVPTMRIATLLMLKEMLSQGQPIPPQMLIRLADIPEREKQEIISGIDSQMQSQAQQSKEVQSTEILKSIMGKGILPQQVEQQIAIKAAGDGLQGGMNGGQPGAEPTAVTNVGL